MPPDLPCHVLLFFGVGSAYDPPPMPGLLLERRETESGVEGLVAYAQDAQGRWHLTVRWEDMGRVRVRGNVGGRE